MTSMPYAVDTRLIGGRDLTFLYLEQYTDKGEFGFKYQHLRLDEFSQITGGDVETILRSYK